ncbi:MAG: hypothetical protein QOJ89_3104 [bacterium]|jgi:hypothetical protein
MPKLVLAPVLAVLSLIAATPAPAAPPWSEPATIATGIPQIGEPSIDFTGSGRAVLSARLTTQAQGVPSHGFSRLWGQQPDGSFAGRARLVLAAPPVAYGNSRLALLRLPLAKGDLSIDDLDRPSPTSLGYGLGHCCGALEVDPGGYRRLTSRAARGGGAIAADGRGDVAATWVEHLSGRDHLVVAVRRRSQPFGRPSVIAGSGFISSPSLAWSARGDLVVAYQRSVPRRGPVQRSVEARVRRAGHGWSRVWRLGPSSGFSVISTAASANGRMVVAWGTQDGGEEAGTPWIVRAAMRAAGARGFRTTQRLDVSEGHDERPAGGVTAAMAPDGTATVAWSSIAGARYPHTFPVRAATARSSLRFGDAQTLAPNAAVGDAAIDARGTALVVWATLTLPGANQISSDVFASLRGPGEAAFAAPEAVGPAERAELPRAAFDPVTGRPAVVWVSRVDGIAQRLRFAARTG